MNEMRRCANPYCRRLFLPNPRVKNQRYCDRKDCQRVRRRLWQREKMRSDPDYRANQQDCQRRWRKQNPDYWRKYRMGNPQYVERNRLLQRIRDEKRRGKNLAKMDALWRKFILIPAT